MKRNTIFLFAVVLFLQFQSAIAQKGEGGMWMPQKISQNEKDMQNMGMSLSADEIWDTSKPSIKDAIVQLGNGCTGEIVSPNGLVFTNHHCGFDAIQTVSTMENNYLKNGFWASTYEEEIPVTGVDITFIDDIKDVTAQVLDGVKFNMAVEERQSIIDKNLNKIKEAAIINAGQKVKIKPYFKGNEYYLITSTTYTDIRFVGAPPVSIGKFGADTDNWEWPRHTGDFSIFRVYAGSNNEPAPYSIDNKPYKPKYYLPISIDGVEVNDFTMVIGFPGRTNEYLTSYAVKSKMDARNPARVKVREASLAIMDKHMKKDEATRLKLASKYAGIANYWKFFIGESKGLKKFNVVKVKQDYEAEFTKRIKKKKKLRKKYADILPQLKDLYEEMESYGVVMDYNTEIFSRNIDMTTSVMIFNELKNLYENNGDDFYNTYKDRFKAYLYENLYKDFDSTIDEEVFAKLISIFTENVDKKYITPEILEGIDKSTATGFAKELYSNSFLSDLNKVEEIFKNDGKTFVEIIINDPFYKLIMSQSDLTDKLVASKYNELDKKIQNLMQKYMQAQMIVFEKDKQFFPDANFTMRVSYGNVKGYHPKDAVYYEPFSHLKGVMEKYKPGDYEFDVSQKLIDLYNAKDFGVYANSDGTMPVNYLATTHITGGNSGSPVIDANGNLIGLAFDGVWEGLMEDIYYRPEISRSIMVDSRYVLFVIDKYAGCKHIMDELKIVHPKK